MGKFSFIRKKSALPLGTREERLSASRRLLCVKALALIGIFLYAAEPVFSAGDGEKTISITSFTGGNVILIRDGKEYLFLRPGDIPKGGVVVQDYDVIQTSAGAFAELRLKPSGLSIRIAENSSLAVENIANSGNILMLSLAYGRIRAAQKGKSRKSRNSHTVIVKVKQSLVEMQNGDISIDHTIVPGMHDETPPAIYISTFSGTAEFIPSVDQPSAEHIKLKKKETFIFYAHEGRFQKWVLDKETAKYWKKKRK
jgi:hypothetical protein